MSLEPAIAAGLDSCSWPGVAHARLVPIAMVAVASAGASLTARRLSATPGELEAA